MQSKIQFLIFCISIFYSQLAFSQKSDHIPGEAIIQYQANVIDEGRIYPFAKKIDPKYSLAKALYPELGIYLVTFDPSINISTALRELSQDDHILYAQKNQKLSPRSTNPDDPFFLDQWYHTTIESAKAWDVTTGGNDINGREIVIAILDSGFDIDHEDFASNVWINKDEIPDDQIDNDNNGYVDDYYGWNPLLQTDEHAAPGQGILHGTNVAGIAGARGDNDRGIAGVAWDVKLLFLSNLESTAEIIEANRYASETRRLYNETNGAEGAYIVATNLSLGIRNGKAEDYPIWCNVYDVMGQNGVLNVVAADNLDSDIDINGDMPATCPSQYLIAVTNTDINNEKTERAAYGRTSVDIGAPGTDNITTSPNNNYNNIEGTSVSAPLVAGAIALLYSAPCQSIADQAITKAGETALVMKNLIFSGAKPSPSLENITSQGAVLNVWESIQALERSCASGSTVENKLTLIPNPVHNASQDITLDYSALADGDSYIRIFDVKGAMIMERKISRTFFGTCRITLPTQGRLSKGVYIVSMILSDDTVVSEKLVVY